MSYNYLPLAISFFAIAVVGTAFQEPKVPKRIPQIDPAAHFSVLASEKTTPFLKIKSPKPPQLTGRAVFIKDLDSEKILLARNYQNRLLPASTTKIATALVALSAFKLQEVLKVNIPKISGQTMGLLNGEEITAENLIKGLLIFSANDAAEVLARNFPGGREAFIGEMNNLAKGLNLSNTNFANPTGFDQDDNFSSAEDLTKLAQEGIKNETFAKIVSTQAETVTSTSGVLVHNFSNINQLLGKVPGVIGIKTGFTENSGESLVTLIERNNHKIIISLLGSTDRFGETTKLIDWIFENYEWETRFTYYSAP